MMVIENIYQAKTHLSRLIDRALEGDDVVISRSGKPLVRLIRYEEMPTPLIIGKMKGLIQIADDFNELTPDIEDAFEGYLPE